MLAGEQSHEFLFDDRRVGFGVVEETKSPAQALDMGVDDEAVVDAKGIAEDDIGGLAGDASELEQVGHVARDLTLENFDDHGHRGMNGFGFVAKKPDGFDVWFNLRRRRFGKISGALELLEQCRRCLIHARVGRLRTENRCNEQLMGSGISEFTVRIGIVFLEGIGDAFGPAFLGGRYLGERKGNVFEPAWVVLAFGMNLWVANGLMVSFFGAVSVQVARMMFIKTAMVSEPRIRDAVEWDERNRSLNISACTVSPAAAKSQ